MTTVPFCKKVRKIPKVRKILAKYKDGFWYEAKIINVYSYGKKPKSYYLEWLDGSKDDRVKNYKNIKVIPENTEQDAGIDYILLASLLF